MRRPTLPALGLLAVLTVAACASGPGASPSQAAPTSAPSAAPSAAAEACADATSGTVMATIENNTFSPDPVTAKVGEAIQWTNADAVPHTATLDEGDCGTEQLGEGATGALVFNAAGEYPYHCAVHPDMKGTITITE